MSFAKAISIIMLFYLGCIIVFDLAGVICSILLPEPGGRRSGGQAGFGSIALYYAVWLVAGCFAGSFFCSLSIEFTKKNAIVQKNPIVVLLTAVLLSAVLILFFYSVGEMLNPVVNTFNDYYVPGHAGMTYTYFISFLLSSVVQIIVSNRKK